MININGSKLSLKLLVFSKGDATIVVDRSNLRYKKILMTKPGDPKFTVIPAKDTTLVPAECKKAGYTEAWVMENTNTHYSKEKYSEDEKEIILKWTKALFPSRLDTSEILVRSTEYGNVIRKFYESYGTELIREFYKLVDNIILGTIKATGKSDKNYAIQYDRLRKYNILKFLDDIIEAGDVKIYTDPDLIGSYKRISRATKDGSSIVPDKWCKVFGIVGNRTRANLSLSYETTTTVNVPSNTFGVVAGPRELKVNRSFCLVKDGVIWQKWLGIKTSNKKLVRKMRKAGIIKSGIVYSDEYLINLELLPAIDREYTRFISPSRMAKAEVDVILSRIGRDWAKKRNYMSQKSLTFCPDSIAKSTLPDSEVFLRSLGIYGDHYIPVKTEVDGKMTSYETYELSGHLVGISVDPTAYVTRYINRKTVYIPTSMYDFLTTIEKKHTESGRTWDEEVRYWENRFQDSIDNLRNLKYRFILKKSMLLEDKKIENVQVSVPVGKESSVYVFWKVEKNTVEV